MLESQKDSTILVRLKIALSFIELLLFHTLTFDMFFLFRFYNYYFLKLSFGTFTINSICIPLITLPSYN